MKNLHSNFPQTTANDSKTREVHTPFSGRSSPSAKEGSHLTMNIEFCEKNSGTSKKMRYFRKNKGGGGGGGGGGGACGTSKWIRHCL